MLMKLIKVLKFLKWAPEILVITAISGLIIFFSADRIVSIFSDNQEVIKYGTMYLKISALIFPAYPIFFISNALIQGLKKAKIVMYLNCINY